MEKSFTGLLPPSSCSAGEKTFRKILNKASKHHIPAGFRKDFQPGILREAINLTVERDRRRALDPQDPELPCLNQQISDTISNERKKLWREKVESSKLRENSDKYWRLLRMLSGKRSYQALISPSILGTAAIPNLQPSHASFASSTPRSASTSRIATLISSSKT
jgi:hypothetical protein